jgi:hypothetical protein
LLHVAAAASFAMQVPAPAKVLQVLWQLLASEAEGALAGRSNARAAGADWELGDDDDDDDDEDFETDEEGDAAAAAAAGEDFSSPMAGMKLKGLG